jgi:hypothetical protein
MLSMAKRKTDVQRWLAWVAESSGKTHAQIADEIGVALRTFRAWLYGERSPSRTALKLIERLFGKPKK